MLKPMPVTMNDGSTADLDNAAVARNLGRTDEKIGQVSVFVRELFQNSWDARLRNTPIEFAMEKRRLSRATLEQLFDLGSFPADYHLFRDGFARQIQRGEMKCLLVSDRNTYGLTEEELQGKTRWDNFMNLGVSDTASFETGGNFGLGKTVSFKASEMRTIAVYTRYRLAGAIKSRFLGISMIGKFRLARMVYGDEMQHSPDFRLPRGYAGKIIWSGGDVHPLEDGKADAVARELGIGSFRDGQTGTDILIFDIRPLYQAFEDEPDVNDEDKRLQDALLSSFCWSFWPRLVYRPDGTIDLASLDFRIRDDRGYDLAHALERYVGGQSPQNQVIAEFMRLYEDSFLTDPPNNPGHELSAYRPPRTIGKAAFRDCANLDSVRVKRSLEDGVFYPDTMHPGETLHHVALMRQVGHVVTYADEYIDSAGVKPAQSSIGVFVASAEASKELFSLAEGPAHDRWTAQEYRERGGKTRPTNPVRDFERSLKCICAEEYKPRRGPTVAVDVEGAIETGKLLQELGGGLSVDPPGSACTLHGRINCPLCKKPARQGLLRIIKSECAREGEDRRLSISFAPNDNDKSVRIFPSVSLVGETGPAEGIPFGDGFGVVWQDSGGTKISDSQFLVLPPGNKDRRHTAIVTLTSVARARKIRGTILAEEVDA